MIIKRTIIFILSIMLIPYILLSGQNQWTTAGPIGGSVWSIGYSLLDNSTIFIGTSDGGLYKSTDAGNTWNFNGMDLLYSYHGGRFITSNFIITNNNTILIASREVLYKSSDLGDHWEKIYSSISGFISSIVIHPNNYDIIYIGFTYGSGGMFGNPGIYKTTDGGDYWYPVNEGLTNLDITDLKMSTNNPDILYAATLEGIFMTTNVEVNVWRNISGNLPAISVHAIALDSTELNTIYVGTGVGVFKSNNRGESWQNVTGDNFKNRFINLQALTVFGKNDKIVFAGTYKGLYKSIDGGMSWEEKNTNLTNLSINYILPINEDEILLGTRDGFYKSGDGGYSWHKKVEGIIAFNNTSISFNDQASVFVGTTGAGIYYSDDTGENWYDVGIDTGFTYISSLSSAPSNPQIMYAAYIGETDSTITQTGLIMSEDSGFSWNPIGLELNGKYIFSITIDPQNAENIFVGTLNNKIYKSINGGQNWINKSNGITVDGILSIAFDPQNSDVIYAGTEFDNIYADYGVYKSIDGGEYWEHSSNGFPVETCLEVLDLCINPINTQTIYAALKWEGIYKSTNGGASWNQINNGVGIDENRIINSIVIDPLDTNRVYAAGVKIYISEDAGQTWQEMMEGLPRYFYRVINTDFHYVLETLKFSISWNRFQILFYNYRASQFQLIC